MTRSGRGRSGRREIWSAFVDLVDVPGDNREAAALLAKRPDSVRNAGERSLHGNRIFTKSRISFCLTPGDHTGFRDLAETVRAVEEDRLLVDSIDARPKASKAILSVYASSNMPDQSLGVREMTFLSNHGILLAFDVHPA